MLIIDIQICGKDCGFTLWANRVWPLIWTNLNPRHQECFVPNVVEIGQMVLEKKILKFLQCIFGISWLSPLGIGCGPSFEQTWIPFTQEFFVPTLFEIGPVVLEKMIKIRKVYTQTDRRHAFLAFSSAQVSEKQSPGFIASKLQMMSKYTQKATHNFE